MDTFFLLSVLGWTGALCTITGYGLLTAGRLAATSRLFQGLNITGSAFLFCSAYFSQAWPSAAVNALWAFIGLHALIMMLRTKKEAAPEPVPVEWLRFEDSTATPPTLPLTLLPPSSVQHRTLTGV
ncbi:hypothetical protein GCM10027403_00470 [Arthrobacter tecti]